MDAAIDDVRAALERARAVVVVADPGAGKTTRVPPALLDAGPAILLQPRRAAARAIARRIAQEQGWTAGVEVGWQVRFERRFTTATRLLVATEGILTARLQDDPLLSAFSTVVLDEFHERSLHADLAVALTRQASLARPDLRVVVMSATLDAQRVSSFLGGCPIVRVPGRLHPIQVQYLPAVPVEAAVQRALAETDGSVLVFEPGMREIERTVLAVRAATGAGIEVLPLHGTLPADEQQRALDATPRRRVIVATNIAETSVTVPGITAVVDRGLEKVARYDAPRALDSLATERISQAAADQRAGRAGRVGPGVVYRLWPSSDRLKPFREPDIQRVDVSGVALDVFAWGGDPSDFDWFEPPRTDALEAAVTLLERLGAVKHARLAEVGRRMHRLPLPPRLARIAVEGRGAPEVLRAVAALAESRFTPAHPAVTDCDLDFVREQWSQAPEQIRSLARQLESLCPPESAGRVQHREEDLRRALLAGYPDRVARRRAPHSDRVLLSSGTGAVVSAESGVRNSEYLVALELRSSPRANDPEQRIAVASAIDREWLQPTSRELVHRLDEHGAVKAAEVVRYDALVLSEHPVPPDPDRSAELIASAILASEPPQRDRRLLRRAAFAGVSLDYPALVRLAAYGARTLAEVDVTQVLPPDAARAIDAGAPEMLVVPSGRQARLEYGEDGTVEASVKLQELFGLAETPRVGPRREPVLLSLLAPNGRPVQLTRDLRSFWERTYPEVRRELRGRYPKHPWPEDPWTAQPTARAKPKPTR